MLRISKNYVKKKLNQLLALRLENLKTKARKNLKNHKDQNCFFPNPRRGLALFFYSFGALGQLIFFALQKK
jgi:hypothetical protein